MRNVSQVRTPAQKFFNDLICNNYSPWEIKLKSNLTNEEYEQILNGEDVSSSVFYKLLNTWIEEFRYPKNISDSDYEFIENYADKHGG